MRKYEISCTIILQSLAQIKKMYKDDWGTILGNCDSLLFLGCKEYDTQEYISKQLGKAPIRTRGTSMSKSGKGSYSESYSVTARDLMTPDEVGLLPNDECIYMLRGVRPFRDKKHPYTTHPNYKLTADADNKKNAYTFKPAAIRKTYEEDEETDSKKPVGVDVDNSNANNASSKEVPEIKNASETSASKYSTSAPNGYTSNVKADSDIYNNYAESSRMISESRRQRRSKESREANYKEIREANRKYNNAVARYSYSSSIVGTSADMDIENPNASINAATDHISSESDMNKAISETMQTFMDRYEQSDGSDMLSLFIKTMSKAPESNKLSGSLAINTTSEVRDDVDETFSDEMRENTKSSVAKIMEVVSESIIVENHKTDPSMTKVGVSEYEIDTNNYEITMMSSSSN